MSKSSPVYITGATGVIGRLLINKLDQHGIAYNAFKGDIRNASEVRAWLDKDAKVIIHLAAFVPVDLVQKDPLKAFQVNVGGMMNILEVIQEKKLTPWFFYSSTSHVYKSSMEPIREDYPLEPITLYGETKLIAERILEEFAKAYSLPYCIGRLFSFYHPIQTGNYLYPSLLRRFHSEDLSKPFLLRGADSVRDIVNAEVIVDYMYQLMMKKAEGIINVASGKGVTIMEFAQSIAPVPVSIEKDGDAPAVFLVADNSKLSSVLN